MLGIGSAAKLVRCNADRCVIPPVLKGDCTFPPAPA